MVRRHQYIRVSGRFKKKMGEIMKKVLKTENGGSRGK